MKIYKRKEYKCVVCGKLFTKFNSREKYTKCKFCSRKCFMQSGVFIHNKPHNKLSKLKIRNSKLGRKNIKMVGHKFWGGENAKKHWFGKGQKPHNYKGGTSTARNIIHNSAWYNKWRKFIFEKSNYKCEECGSNGQLHIHHIEPWSKNPELRFDINNVIVLCVDCHCKKHKVLRNFIKHYKNKKK